MRILMLGNSYTYANDMPVMLAELTGAEVVQHTRGGARLSEHLHPESELGAKTQLALRDEKWDYVVLQEQSFTPVRSRESFLESVRRLCPLIQSAGATPILYATWAYKKGFPRYEAMGVTYEEMAAKLEEAYHAAADENHALIADVGRRFFELSDTENLYWEDYSHPIREGSMLAARTIAEVIEQHEKEKADSTEPA